MGIYNRDYYRETISSSAWDTWNTYGLTPVVKWLILANAVVFLLQIFIVREPPAPDLTGLPDADEIAKHLHRQLHRLLQHGQQESVVQEWLELDTAKVVEEGQVWRLLTSAFCHDRLGVWHILINMVVLFWFGCTLEMMYGGCEFLLFYLTAAVVASLAFIGLDLYTGDRVPAVGASGAVLAVVMLYAWHFPYEEFLVCWILPLQMRWVLLLYVIWDLHPVLLALSGDRIYTGIGHAAHLGGLAFGFLYARFEWRLEPLFGRLHRPRSNVSRPPLRLLTAEEPRPDPDADQVDAILRKIVETGQASLTDEEREILQGASERLRQGR